MTGYGPRAPRLSTSLARIVLTAALLTPWAAGCGNRPEEPQASVGERPSIPSVSFDTLSFTLQWGQSFGEMLTRAGVPQQDQPKIVSAFDSVQNVRSLPARSRFAFLFDSLHVLQKILYWPETYRLCGVARGEDGWQAFDHSPEVYTRIRRLAATVKTTVYDAVLEAGETPEFVMLFSDIFQWDVDFFVDPQAGDELKAIYEVKYVDTPDGPARVGYGKILAAQYTLSGKPISAIYFDNPKGKSGYYDSKGRSFQKAFLKSPLNYRKITSYFTGARRHPIYKKVRPHYAVDFAAPAGTPVVAAGDGTVIERGYNAGLGNYIKIRHTNPRYVTLYGHLRAFAKGVRLGASVRQNQVIGFVGQSGVATGPHLHYAFYENGRPINPLRIRNVTGDPVPQEAMNAFAQVRAVMLDRLAAIQPKPPSLYLTGGWPFVPSANAISVPEP